MNEDEIKKRSDHISGLILHAFANFIIVGGLTYKEGLLASKCMVALLAEVDRNPRVNETALADEARSWLRAELRKL